ncbi:MAG TPA: wax ester/triacylglycerol synthase family O-acyltransferase [Casimicrobiaceae bacterium]
MQRLSTLDTSFLRVETPSAHMHVGWLASLRLPDGVRELDPAKLSQRIAARLHLAPRFRQLVSPAPFGEPIWVDDPAFRLDRHVTVAPEPVRGRRDLERLAGSFLSRQLDRRRPLWQIVVVPRAGQRRAAVLGKVHHAMVDGIAAVELGTLLFDLAPDAAPPEPAGWEPEPAGAPLRIAADALADSALEQFRAARRVAAMGLRPRSSLRVAETMRRAALSLAEDMVRPAVPSFVNAEIGPRRALVTERVSLARLERIKRARDAKLNDVVLAVVAGALRQYADVAGADPAPLRAMVPVSVRATGDTPAEGNRITFAFVDLPLDEPDPARQLALVCERTGELKRSGRIAGSDALLRTMVQLPGFLKERAARLAASPRMYNLAVSNVPGPRIPLYAAGSLVEEIHPVIPTSDGHAIAIGVLTYRDSLHFAAYVDPEALPDAHELGRLFRQSVGALEHSVRRGSPRRRDHERNGRSPVSTVASRS